MEAETYSASYCWKAVSEKRKMRYLTIVTICFLFACQSRPNDYFNFTGSAEFHTTPPSRIYFKNIRSYHYQAGQVEESSADFFQLGKWAQQLNSNAIIPTIIDHWIEDEAYLFLLPSPASLQDQDWEIQVKEETGYKTLLQYSKSPEDHWKAFQEIMDGLEEGKAFYILQDGERTALWTDSEVRSYFNIVQTDFLRLTEAL